MAHVYVRTPREKKVGKAADLCLVVVDIVEVIQHLSTHIKKDRQTDRQTDKRRIVFCTDIEGSNKGSGAS